MADPSRVRLILACCASGLIAAACAGYAPATGAARDDLTGTRWVASAINGAPIAGPRSPTLSFEVDYRLTGSGGCNRLFAVYEVEDESIDVRGLGRTKMACAEPVMSIEEAFVDILDDANSYDRDASGRLVIAAADGRSVVLAPSSG